MIGCPPAEKWRQYLQDRLSPSQERALTEHVEECPACEAFLSELTTPCGAARASARVSRPPPELVRRLGQLWSAAFPPDDWAAPERWPAIDGYEILGVLGRGGMGIVYRARQCDLGREVALKMIAAGERSSTVDASRLLNDASTAAQLRHEQIVPVYAVGQYRGLPYCVMELITGGSLAQRVADLVNDPWEAARLVAAASRALHHAHRHGVCHRDVKPANILLRVRYLPPPASELDPDGISVPYRPRLCEVDACVSDFGLAKRTREEAGLTLDGELVGTPEYMAPEQIRSRKPAPAADIYGLGAVLYECLTGQPPSRGATRFDTLLLTLHEEPERPRRLNSRLPRDLETICLKCLEKEPQRRYGSALALAEDLERWLKGEPVRARPVGSVGRAWRWSRRKPVAAALLLSLLIGSGTSLYLWHRTAASLQREQAARRESEESFAMLRQLMTNNVHVSGSWPRFMNEANLLPEAMLTDAESCLSRLLQKRPEDQELRALLADVLTCLGSRRGPSESLALLEKAARLWEQIPPESAEVPTRLASRATTYRRLGQLYYQQGRLALALQSSEVSLRWWKRLAERYREIVYQDGLFYTAADVAICLIADGGSEEEILRRHGDLRARPELLGGDQGSEVLLDLLRAQRLCASAEGYYQAQKRGAGLAAARKAAALLDRYYEQPTLDQQTCVRLARPSVMVSAALRHVGALQEALRLIERVNGCLQALASRSQDAPYVFEEMSQSWHEIGKVHWELGETERTLHALRRALAAQQHAYHLASGWPEYRAELGQRYLQLGRKLCELGLLDEAESCFRERQALWPGDATKQREALQELQKWAAQGGKNEEQLSPKQQRTRQHYLDLGARLEGKPVGYRSGIGNTKP